MKKIRLILSLLALIVGGSIVGVSLLSASSSQAYQDNDNLTKRRLYWDSEILPDNVIYPLLAMNDRARLELAPITEKIYLQVEYSQRRLGYTKSLLLKGDHQLATTTLSKSQKYLNLALTDCLNNQLNQEVHNFLLTSVDYHQRELNELYSQLTPEEQRYIDSLKTETQSLKEQLSAQAR